MYISIIFFFFFLCTSMYATLCKIKKIKIKVKIGMLSVANKLITDCSVNEQWSCADEYEVYCVSRCEIEATLERLKRLERDLSTKEQVLKERERRLKMWERKLIEQSNIPVSLYMCFSILVNTTK